MSHAEMSKQISSLFLFRFDLKGKIENVRSKIMFKSCDAILTARLRSKRRGTDYLQSVFNPSSPNYERVASLTNLIDIVIPGSAKRASDFLLRSGQLPFVNGHVKLMAYGSGATVFLMELENERKVLKVYRRSLGKFSSGLQEMVRIFEDKYKTVSSWYNGSVRLVPPARFLILHGPLFGSPAAAVIQPYIDGEKKDFFQDFTDAELIEMMNSNDTFKEEFLFFADQTLRIYAEQGLCVDFLGRDNLMLVKNGAEIKLWVVDNGIFDLEVLKKEGSTRYTEIEAYITRVRALREKIVVAAG